MNYRYVPKNILVTGGAGFIGSHMVLYLLKNYPQYRIINLDKLDECSSLAYFKDIKKFQNYYFVKGDVRSTDLVLFVLRIFRVDTILHFAASSHVDHSFGNSISFTENNVLGTHILLECSRKAGIKRFLHISTDEVYGESAYGDASIESTMLAPTNPYAASKAAAEHFVQAYFKSFKLPLIIARSNNVFGPHQYPEKLIPKFILRLSKGLSCCIHGDGTSKRGFLYIEDAVRAFNLILHNGDHGNIYNIEAPGEYSVLEVAKKIIKLFNLENKEDELMEFVSDRAFNDVRYNVDGSKLRVLGFEPRYSFDEGLKLTYEWYMKIPMEEIWKFGTPLDPFPISSKPSDNDYKVYHLPKL